MDVNLTSRKVGTAGIVEMVAEKASGAEVNAVKKCD